MSEEGQGGSCGLVQRVPLFLKKRETLIQKHSCWACPDNCCKPRFLIHLLAPCCTTLQASAKAPAALSRFVTVVNTKAAPLAQAFSTAKVPVSLLFGMPCCCSIS